MADGASDGEAPVNEKQATPEEQRERSAWNQFSLRHVSHQTTVFRNSKGPRTGPRFPNDLDGREGEGLGGFLEQPAVGGRGRDAKAAGRFPNRKPSDWRQDSL